MLKKRKKKLRQLSIHEVEALKGIYQSKYSTVEIFIKENRPYLLFNGSLTMPLKPLGMKKFQLGDHYILLTFSGRENHTLNISEPGENSIRYKWVRKERFSTPSLGMYVGEYFSRDIEIRYTITAQDNVLQLKRTPYDQPNPLTLLTENVLSCSFGELRFQQKNGTVIGFTLNAERATNIKFKKVK